MGFTGVTLKPLLKKRGPHFTRPMYMSLVTVGPPFLVDHHTLGCLNLRMGPQDLDLGLDWTPYIWPI